MNVAIVWPVSVILSTMSVGCPCWIPRPLMARPGYYGESPCPWRKIGLAWPPGRGDHGDSGAGVAEDRGVADDRGADRGELRYWSRRVAACRKLMCMITPRSSVTPQLSVIRRTILRDHEPGALHTRPWTLGPDHRAKITGPGRQAPRTTEVRAAGPAAASIVILKVRAARTGRPRSRFPPGSLILVGPSCPRSVTGSRTESRDGLDVTSNIP